jgi:choline kinase
MNCIILGDKFQKRMKSKGCVGLIKVNNKSIIQNQYKIINQVFPEVNVVYVYGFEHKRFQSFLSNKTSGLDNLTSIYNHSFEKYNNAYSLSLVEDFLNDDCMIFFGDLILSRKTFDKFMPQNGSQIFINQKNKNRLGCVINNSKIENIAYDLDNYLSEIYFLTKNHSIMIKDLLKNKINHNCFIFEIINKLIDMDQTISPLFSENISSLTLLSNRMQYE